MSQFVTQIPVPVEEIKRLLPNQHFLESVTWDPIMQTVDIVWSSPALVTPFSTPQLFPIQNLHDRTLPSVAKYRASVTSAEPAAQPVVEKPIDKNKRRTVKGH